MKKSKQQLLLLLLANQGINNKQMNEKVKIFILFLNSLLCSKQSPNFEQKMFYLVIQSDKKLQQAIEVDQFCDPYPICVS